MSSDRRMQFFIERIFPIIWDRFKIPVESTYPIKPSDFKCRDISPALIELCSTAIWVQSKIVFHHWIPYMRKYYSTMVSSPKAFVKYVIYACNCMDYNTKDHYERFVTVCSLLVGFGANFYYSGRREVIQFIPKILSVFFDFNISEQFNARGSWKRLDKYLLRQDYLSWHDETPVNSPNETKEQKLARELSVSKKVEMAIKATYSHDYDLYFICEKYIEEDLGATKMTDKVMEYFLVPTTPSSPEESQGVKKRKCKATDKLCAKGMTKKKIIENLVEFVKHSNAALETNQQNENDGSSTQPPTETNTQNDQIKTGVCESVSSKEKVATSTKKRRSSKNKKQDTSNDSKNNEIVPFKENLSFFRFSAPQSEEKGIKQTEISLKQTIHANSDDGESNQQTKNDGSSTQQPTESNTQNDQIKTGVCESVSSEEKIATSTKKRRSSKNKKQDTSSDSKNNEIVPFKENLSLFSFSAPQSEEKGIKQTEISLRQATHASSDDDESVSSNRHTAEETNRKTTHKKLENESASGFQLLDAAAIKRETLSKQKSVEKNMKQNTSVNLECIESFSGNQQTEEIKQKSPKKTESDTASENQHFSGENTEPKSTYLKAFQLFPSNDQPIENVTGIKSGIVRDNGPSSWSVGWGFQPFQQSTETTHKDTCLNIAESYSVSNTQEVSESAKIKSVFNNQQFSEETNEQTSRGDLRNNESLSNPPLFPEVKLQKTFQKTDNFFSIASMSTGLRSKKEAVAEIKSIAESLVPKLEELAVVIASLLWDLRHDI